MLVTMLIFLHAYLRFILHFDYVCLWRWMGVGWWVCAYEFNGPQRTEEGMKSPGTEVKEGCKLPNMSAGNQTRVFGMTSVCS